MSWDVLNHLLGLAVVDPHFWQELQCDPLAASQNQGFDLTAEEQRVLSSIQAESLVEFSQCLLEELENPTKTFDLAKQPLYSLGGDDKSTYSPSFQYRKGGG